MKRNTGNATSGQMKNKKKRTRKPSKKTLATVPTRQEVQSMITKSFNANVEHKTHYRSPAFNSVSLTYPFTTGLFIDLTNMSQSATFGDRIGQEVRPTSVEIRYNIFTPDTNGQDPTFMLRMICFILNINSGIWVATDILHDMSTGTLALVSPFANSTRDHRKILWDYNVDLFDHSQAAGAGGASTRCSETHAVGNVYIPLFKLARKWLPCSFDGNTTSGENHIGMLIISNIEPADQLDGWNINLYTAVNFTDA